MELQSEVDRMQNEIGVRDAKIAEIKKGRSVSLRFKEQAEAQTIFLRRQLNALKESVEEFKKGGIIQFDELIPEYLRHIESKERSLYTEVDMNLMRSEINSLRHK